MHTTKVETLRDEAKRQLQLLKELLQKAHRKGLVDKPAKNERDRSTFDTESLPKVLEVLNGESHKLDNLDMVLAVVGTMKAGKSTSINAIVGAEVLPNRNRPMTALPTLIRHTPNILTPRLRFEKVPPLNDLLLTLDKALKKATAEAVRELQSDADMAELLKKIQQQETFASHYEGEQGIFDFLKSLNDLVRLCFALNVDFPFSEYATVDAMPVIEVEFSHLKNTPATQGRLTLLDTPGPNEAGQQHLRHMLKDQLKKASAVLAVLDYTQLKSDADAQVRENLLEVSETAKGRMYALVNKFDQRDRNSDDAATVRHYVSKTLLKGAIDGGNVFPVSASQGYLASRARNEIEHNGKLNIPDSWVEDFGEEAFGKRWEKFINDPREVKDGADELWRESGFASPLEQVIVEAHQNAALEALRSAASKLDTIARDSGNFFKANARALKINTTDLQKNINNLLLNIESIDQIEKETIKALKASLTHIKTKIQAATEVAQNELEGKVEKHQEDGKLAVKNLIAKIKKIRAQQEKEEEEENSRSGFGAIIGATIGATIDAGIREIKKINGPKFRPNKPAPVEENITKKAEDGIFTFEEKSLAENFAKEIEISIQAEILKAEKELQFRIKNGIEDFKKEFDRYFLSSLEKIRDSAQNNINEFDIEIRLTSARSIAMNATTSVLLEDAIEEKSELVTYRRRQSGLWGELCDWLDTDEWGWEPYKVNEKYYEVNLNNINKLSKNRIDALRKTMNDALDHEIYPQLNDSVEEFFLAFRKKIEHIRGDLISSIQKHSLDQTEKAALLQALTRLAREAAALEKDCSALNEAADTLRSKEGVFASRGEVLA